MKKTMSNWGKDQTELEEFKDGEIVSRSFFLSTTKKEVMWPAPQNVAKMKVNQTAVKSLISNT